MKVSACRKCKYFKEHQWSQRFKPRNYHAIGMTYTYGYCSYHKKRGSDVKRTDCIPNQITMFDRKEQ